MFKPKVGEIVAVCYDGKAGRTVDGVVVKTKSGKIKVRFDEWAGDMKGIEYWFPRTTARAFGGYVKVKDGLMEKLFGTPGDWYSVYRK